MGKNDTSKAEQTLGNCFTMQIIISLILTVILFLGNRSFLLAFGASANTIDYAVGYMNIYAVGTIFVQLTLGMNNFITAQGLSLIHIFVRLFQSHFQDHLHKWISAWSADGTPEYLLQ